MPVLAHVSDDGSHLVITITGELTRSVADWAIPDVVARIRAQHITKVLIDARERSPVFSSIDRYELGQLIDVEPAFDGVYFAVVVRGEYPETFGRMRGAGGCYFNEYDQAVAWLQAVPHGQ